MSRPKPLETGDQKHLTWGSTRWSIARQMRLVADAAEGPLHGQYAALLAGVDVALTREQVAGLVPPNKRPANLAEHKGWVLRGDDALVPAS
jgi:hypothetical protein